MCYCHPSLCASIRWRFDIGPPCIKLLWSIKSLWCCCWWNWFDWKAWREGDVTRRWSGGSTLMFSPVLLLFILWDLDKKKMYLLLLYMMKLCVVLLISSQIPGKNLVGLQVGYLAILQLLFYQLRYLKNCELNILFVITITLEMW